MEALLCIILLLIFINLAFRKPMKSEVQKVMEAKGGNIKNHKVTDEELITVILPTINNDGQ